MLLTIVLKQVNSFVNRLMMQSLLKEKLSMRQLLYDPDLTISISHGSDILNAYFFMHYDVHQPCSSGCFCVGTHITTVVQY